MRGQTIIVGAGPAGLAVAACLKRRGQPAVILESQSEVGSSWRNHYDRLHLHTHKGGSALPGLPFPAHHPRYPARGQVVEYLEGYARHFGLLPSFNEAVTEIVPDAQGWRVRTERRELTASDVVLATGQMRIPVEPSWPGLSMFQGQLLHSRHYRNGAAWKGKRVLVVGFGNSGGEIAIDLHEHGALPTVSVRSPINIIPREYLGLPILAVAGLLRPLPVRVADFFAKLLIGPAIGRLGPLGLTRKRIGPNQQVAQENRSPFIDIGTLALIRKGHVQVAKAVERFTPTGVVFTDGVQAPFDAVVLATGYRDGLEALLPAVRTGPGLHRCGYRASTRGMLKEIAVEAERIAREIDRPGRLAA